MGKLIKTEIIESYMQGNNLSKTQFCKLCKISIGTLYRLLSNDINVELISFFRISKVIDIQIHQMFN